MRVFALSGNVVLGIFQRGWRTDWGRCAGFKGEGCLDLMELRMPREIEDIIRGFVIG